MKPQSSATSMTDLLNLSKQAKLMTLLQPKEQIISSCDVYKFNDANKCQTRILLITDLAIYNVIRNQNFIKSMMSKLVSFQNKYTVRRRIPFQNLEGITLSNQPQNLQFVLHVFHQHDYRLKALDYETKVSILKVICKNFQKIKHCRLAFYFTNDITLEKRWRQKCDNKKKRHFDGNPIYLTFQALIDYQPEVNFELMFSKNDHKLPISAFKSMSVGKFIKGYKYYSSNKKQLDFNSLKTYLQNNHPFIALPDYIYKTSAQTLYFLKPLYIGGRMDKFIQKNGTLYRQLFTFYMAQLILALQFLHKRGWIYRSLMLENIYIRSNGYLRIQGLTKNMIIKKQQQQKFYGYFGKNQNIAPEVILCEGYNQQIDIWQLGLVAYQMFKGAHPFATHNKKQMFRKILNEQPPQQKTIPNFIKKMLKKNPSFRVKNWEQIKKDEWFKDINWQQILNEEVDSIYKPQLDDVNEWQGKIPSIVYADQ